MSARKTAADTNSLHGPRGKDFKATDVYKKLQHLVLACKKEGSLQGWMHPSFHRNI